MTSYLLFAATIAGIYALLGLGLVVIWGQTGMVNLGLAGFFALGAYASALLTKNLPVPIAMGWLAAMALTALVGMALTWVTRSMRGDYLAIMTLSFAEVIRLVAVNEAWLTNSIDGISEIPAPMRASLGDQFNLFYFALTWAVVGLAYILVRRLVDAPFGRVLRAVRDDNQVAAVAGKAVLSFKMKAFMLGSALAGLAGAMYAHYTAYIAPDLFTPLITIYIFLAVTAGGYTRPAGAILGALFVNFLLEGTRFAADHIAGLSGVQIASLREIVIAAALIALMHLRPQGMLPERLRRASANTGSQKHESA
ncbi:branched-chain amino acid ABC transporter permease [Variovorax sp. LG9.2]|uniref:branched-chain amino acid ABC transporter permease n=1 Tax=Variovorax sp. LG9.2 TaxID=3048626 RepID=UPI002B225C5C|nr:branched-chain amino acid ABC transporter permease [Variovorax sp. LG9.2]MEB0060275.1 branched-chain amino acid ABC transporter permease [Variovorax sp. LG9.2]